MKRTILCFIIGIILFSGLNNAVSFELINDSLLNNDYTKDVLPLYLNDTFDMVVITSKVFEVELLPLIEHKNEYGVKTFLKTTEEIYEEFEGRDKPEQIKYFIKHSIEEFNIRYVLLVGGLKSVVWSNPRDTCNYGDKGWYVPVRYTNMIEPISYQVFDPGFISDLYYADIYDSSGNFSSWDSNENGVFAEWNMRENGEIDILDMYPDIGVGRLACRNKNEVKTIVNKIINYERPSIDKTWFNRFIAAGGDPLNDIGTQYPEGEILGDHIINNYMTEFESIRLYASFKESKPCFVPKFKNIKRELENGCGFFLLDAHGSPARTKTFWPGDFDPDNMINCLSVYNLPFLKNKDKLPIIILGGCWCLQFNVSFLGDFISGSKYWSIPTPESIGWRLLQKSNGGGIATLGFTSLGYIRYLGENGDIDSDGIEEPDYVENGWGFLECCFFEALNDSGEYLGDMWKNGDNKYLSTFPIENKYDWLEAKNILAWTLLGDPSLKLGGYLS